VIVVLEPTDPALCFFKPVPRSRGFRVPTTGSEPDTQRLKIKVEAEAGSSEWRPVQKSAGVGAFFDVALNFNPPQASNASELILSCKNYMPLIALDEIELVLPEFEGSTKCLEFLPTSEFPFDKMCWMPQNTTVVMRIGAVIPVRSDLTIRVPIELGVVVPSAGLVKNEKSLTLSARAYYGNVAATSILNSPAIGVIYYPTLSFDPDDAGQPTRISVRFVLGMQVEWSETVTLHLPGFFSGTPDNANTVRNFITEPTIQQRFEKATWFPATEEMVMTVTMSFLAKFQVVEETFRTPVHLPLDGIRWYSTGMTISSSAVAGPVPPTIIPSFNSVGSMRYTELRLEPHVPGAEAEIIVIFRPQMVLKHNTTVTIELGVFSGPTWSGNHSGDFHMDFTGSHRAISSVTWANSTKILTVFIDKLVNENDLVTLRVGSASKIRIPAEGILPNSDQFKIASAQEAGSVGVTGRGGTSFWRTPGIQHVGKILKSSVSYDGLEGPHSDAEIDFELKFTATVTIFVGDVITLYLPKFDSADTLLEAQLWHGLDSPPFAPQPRSGGFDPIKSTTIAMWHPETETLSVKVNYELPGGVEATFFVPRVAGLKLPVDGMNKNQLQLRMSVAADAGDVPSREVMNSPAIGSVSNTSQLTFHPAKAGERTDITLRFATHMQIKRGEVVYLLLPLFERETEGFDFNFTISDVSGTFLHGTWDQLTSLASLTCNKSLEENVMISMVLPDFKIPFVGVRRDEITIALSTDAEDGPMLPTTIFRTQGIGSLTNSTYLHFFPLSSNEDLEVMFEFTAQMDLNPGDVIFLHLKNFYRSNPMNEGFEYQCNSFLRDDEGQTHCSGEFVCISDLCYAPFVFTSKPNQALKIVSWKESKTVYHGVPLPFTRNVSVLNSTTGEYYYTNMTVNETTQLSFLETAFDLEILVDSAIPRGTPSSVFISEESHMRSPQSGLTENDPNITVRVKSSQGDMPPTSVARTQEIGSYQVAELEYLFPVANEVTGLAFKFQTTLSAEVNDTLTLTLPRFQQIQDGPDFFDVLVFVQDPESNQEIERKDLRSRGKWIKQKESIEIKFGGLFPPDVLYVFVIDSSAGLMLPNGVERNSRFLEVMLEAVSGTINPGPISKSTGVGALLANKLYLHPEARAGEISEIVFNFTMTMPLDYGDIIRVQLPGFTTSNISGNTFEVEVELSGSTTAPWIARWLHQSIHISVGERTQGSYDSGDMIVIKVPAMFGFTLPTQGVADETYHSCTPLCRDDNFGTAVTSSNPIVVLKPFDHIAAVGSFWPQDSDFYPYVAASSTSLPPQNTLGGPLIEFSPAKSPTSRDPVPSSLTVSMKPKMAIEKGEVVELTCLNFQGGNISLPTLSPYFGLASWHVIPHVQEHDYLMQGHSSQNRISLSTNAVGVLRLVVTSTVPAGTHVTVEVPDSAGILLPNKGVPRDTIWVQTRARAGPVVATPVWFDPVGSFTTSTSLEYGSNRYAGAEIDVYFGFTATMPILENEFMVLNLPGWKAPLGDFEVESTPFGMILDASWISQTSEIELTAREDIPANTAVKVRIQASASKLTVPLEGTKEDTTAFTLSCSASAGRVLPSPIWRSEAIGSFYRSTRLEVSPLRALAVAQMNFSFFTKMDVLLDEVIMLRLPKFSFQRLNESLNVLQYYDFLDVSPYLQSSPTRAIKNATWNSSTEVLMMTAARVLNVDELVSVFLHSSSGLKIPITGLRSNVHSRIQQGENFDKRSPCPDPVFLPLCRSCDGESLWPLDVPEVSVAARWGPVLPVRVYNTPAIGAFLNHKLFLWPPAVGWIVMFEITFVPAMTLNIESTVKVHLPKFWGATTGGAVNNSDSDFGTFSWHPETQDLILTSRQCIQRGKNVKVVIPEWAGIKVSLDGVSQPPMFSTDTEDGLVLPTPFDDYDNVGTFLKGNLRYEPPLVGSIVSIVVQFTPIMDIVPGEYIGISVPPLHVLDGIESDYCSVPVQTRDLNESSHHVFENSVAHWTGSSGSNCGVSTPFLNSIIVVLGSRISAGTQVEMIVSNSSRLRIKPTGTNENDPEVFLFTNAVAGIVVYEYPYAIPVSEQIRQVGSVRASSLSFGNPKWNASSSLTFSFRFNVVLSRGDYIHIYLPKFKGGPVKGTTDRVPVIVESNQSFYQNMSSESFYSAVQGARPWYINNSFNWSLQNTLSAEWIRSENRLVFTSNVYMPTNYTTVVTIPESFDFIIPFEGIGDLSALTLKADLLAGQVPNTRIIEIQPVGKLWNTRLSFEGASPNSLSSLPCKIIVSFDLPFRVLPGETFEVNLPRFSGNRSSFNILSYPEGHFVHGKWDDSEFPLILSVNKSIGEGSHVEIHVGTNAHIRLPPDGVVSGAKFAQSTPAAKGPVPKYPKTYFEFVTPIGSFEETTKLLFMTPRTESTTAMKLIFTPSLMMIQPGETVKLVLPSFGGKATYDVFLVY
jgi:hypothetical protein